MNYIIRKLFDRGATRQGWVKIFRKTNHDNTEYSGKLVYYAGWLCTFARFNLRSMQCDLCTGDDTAATKLGKERERQVINLKFYGLKNKMWRAVKIS